MTDDVWADESIASTLHEVGLSPGADADLPDEVRFVRRVTESLQLAEARHGPLAAPAVYIYAPVVDRSLPDAATFYPRIHRGEVDPAGGLWLVGAAVRSARHIGLQTDRADEIFAYCKRLGFGEQPAVYCDAAANPRTFGWYPNGLSDTDNVIEGPIDRQNPPTLAELIEVVDRVHHTRLMTSFNQNMDTRLWEDPSQHWAHKRAEKRVQDALMAGLGGAFGRPYFVEEERSGDTGRYDIGFRESAGGGTSTLRAILELKVARSFGSGGVSITPSKVEEHIIDGVEQSAAYVKEHGAADAACLVFDLREEAAQAEPVNAQTRARQLQVFLKFWRCFPTATDYRTFILPDPL